MLQKFPIFSLLFFARKQRRRRVFFRLGKRGSFYASFVSLFLFPAASFFLPFAADIFHLRLFGCFPPLPFSMFFFFSMWQTVFVNNIISLSLLQVRIFISTAGNQVFLFASIFCRQVARQEGNRKLLRISLSCSERPL